MTNHEESEPLLIGDEAIRVEQDGDIPKQIAAANDHFKQPIRALKIVVAVLLALAFITLLGIFISVQVAQLNYTWATTGITIDLGTCVLIAFILTTLSLFINFPILIAVTTDLLFSILLLVYATSTFRYGWPRIDWCPSRAPYPYPPHKDPGQPPAPSCVRFVLAERVLVGIGAGLCYITGFLFLALILLRIIAISRTKFWKRDGRGLFGAGGYSYQLTFTVSKSGAVNAAVGAGADVNEGRTMHPRVSDAEGQLIET